MTNIFSGPKVKPPEVKPMPDQDDPRILLARRRRIAQDVQSGGSRSTLLTSTSGRETLGGG